MGYHTLANDTGGTADDRRSEADRILSILIENDIDAGAMTDSEGRFYQQMADDRQQSISPKQLFWLRDIKDKYL